MTQNNSRYHEENNTRENEIKVEQIKVEKEIKEEETNYELYSKEKIEVLTNESRNTNGIS